MRQVAIHEVPLPHSLTQSPAAVDNKPKLLQGMIEVIRTSTSANNNNFTVKAWLTVVLVAIKDDVPYESVSFVVDEATNILKAQMTSIAKNAADLPEQSLPLKLALLGFKYAEYAGN